MRHFILILLALLVSCQEKDELPVIPILAIGLSDVTVEGATIVGTIENVDPIEIVSYGIVYSDQSSIPNVYNSLKIDFSRDNFTGRIGVNLNTLKPDVSYMARLFVKTTSNIFYSSILTFLSKGSSKPTIKQITPIEANYGDTISIKGKNFGLDSAGINVYFSGTNSNVLFTSDTLINVLVPDILSDEYLKSGSLDVRVFKYNIESELFKNFKILPPRNLGLNSENLYSTYKYTLIGSGFHLVKTDIYFGKNKLKIDSLARDIIIFEAPTLFKSESDSLIIKSGPLQVNFGQIEIFAPEFSTDLEVLFMGAYEEVTLNGNNLDNVNLRVFINDQESEITSRQKQVIQFIVNPYLCSEKLDLTLILGEASKNISNLPVKKSAVSDVLIDVKDYYNAEVVVDLKYAPYYGLGYSLINGSPVTSDVISYSKGNYKVKLRMPETFTCPDGWIHLKIISDCGYEIKVDSLFKIPPPELNANQVVRSFFKTKLEGKYLGGTHSVYFNNQLILRNDYKAPNITLAIPWYYDNGVIKAYVIVNGQKSETVDVIVENSWELFRILDRPDSIPDIRNFYETNMGFIHEDKVYVNDPSKTSNAFYSFDLKTLTKEKLSDSPIGTGLSDFDINAGYVFFQGQFFKYTFSTDLWEQLEGLPGLENLPLWHSSGFIKDNKFFVFTYGAQYGPSDYYYFDLIENKWITMSNGPYNSRGSSIIKAIVGETNVYLKFYYDFYTYDPYGLSILSNRYFGDNFWYDEYSSLQGFEYKNEFYVYERGAWTIVNNASNQIRNIGGPANFDIPKIFLKGDFAYVVSGESLWRFDLTKQ